MDDQRSTTVVSAGLPRIEVTVNAEDRNLTVLVTVAETEVREGGWPLLVLAPEEGGEIQVEKLEREEGTSAHGRVILSAEFDDVEGEYFLFLEAIPALGGTGGEKSRVRPRSTSRKRVKPER